MPSLFVGRCFTALGCFRRYKGQSQMTTQPRGRGLENEHARGGSYPLRAWAAPTAPALGQPTAPCIFQEAALWNT